MITEFRIVVEGRTNLDPTTWVELKVVMEGKTTLNPSDLSIPGMKYEELQRLGREHNLDVVRCAIYWDGGGKMATNVEVERA